jgi:hypothetical protein
MNKKYNNPRLLTTAKEVLDIINSSDDTPFANVTFDDSIAKSVMKKTKTKLVELVCNLYLRYGHIPDCPSIIEDGLCRSSLYERMWALFGRAPFCPVNKKGVFDRDMMIVLPEQMSLKIFSMINTKNHSGYYTTVHLGNIIPDFKYFYSQNLSKEAKCFIFREIRDNYRNIDFFLEHLNTDDKFELFNVLYQSPWDNVRRVGLSELFMTSVYELRDISIKSHFIRRVYGIIMNNNQEETNAYVNTPKFIRDLKREFEKLNISYISNFQIYTSCSRYIKALLKNGLLPEEAVDMFTLSNLSAYISSNYFSDEYVEKLISQRDLTKREIDVINKYRPKLFSKISKDLICNKIKTTMYSALPNSIIKLIDNGIINVDLKVDCDSESIELYQELEKLNV